MQRRLDDLVDSLHGEFAGQIERDTIVSLMADSVARLADTAAIADYLPPLAYRFTKERLRAMVRADHKSDQATRDVVFVSLSGGGRGQLAAALTALRAGGRVTVHSAGTAAHGEIDPAVGAVIAELGIDPDEAFARPVSAEVLRGADVIVTMGQSVGAIDIPDGVRHEDWRVGDPVGAPIEEVRRVRDDIDRRVGSLLETLGVER